MFERHGLRIDILDASTKSTGSRGGIRPRECGARLESNHRLDVVSMG